MTVASDEKREGETDRSYVQSSEKCSLSNITSERAPPKVSICRRPLYVYGCTLHVYPLEGREKERERERSIASCAPGTMLLSLQPGGREEGE